jgi:hypothetical protein
MTTILPHRQITQRDLDLLTMIDRHPFTSGQLLRLSETFSQPFTHDRLLRRRLSQLRNAGLVRDWPFATLSEGGSPHYWRLTQAGFQLLHGYDTPLPGRRLFEEMAPGHHHHSFSLGEFLATLFVAAHREGIAVHHFARENSIRFEAGEFVLLPDCAFQLQHQDGRTFNFVVELDNSTERLRSRMDVESIERKLRGYDAHQSQFDALDLARYQVLFVTTRSPQRLQHILDLAQLLAQNPQRTVFLGVHLKSFLACENPFRRSIVKDHRGLNRTLTPIPTSPPPGSMRGEGEPVIRSSASSTGASPATASR